MSNTIDKLINAWELKEKNGMFVATADEEIIVKKLNSSNFSTGVMKFNFNLKPFPWWGNISQPKIVVLVLNPKYEKEEEDKNEQDLHKKRKSFENNLKNNKTINWLDFVDEANLTVSEKWWKNTFNDIIVELDKKNKSKDLIYDSVGFFELYGYYSKSFKDTSLKNINKSEFDHSDILPTQKALFEHINYLMKVEKPPLLVIIWGQKHWREYIHCLDGVGDELGMDYIDTISTASHSLSKSNLRDRDFKRIIQRLLS